MNTWKQLQSFRACQLQVSAGITKHYWERLLLYHGEGNGNPLQYSCLENPVDRGAWWAAVHRVTQSWTWLNRLSMHALEKEMETHSSILGWKIPGTEEPGGLPSMGSHRVGHNWSDLAAAAVAALLRVDWPQDRLCSVQKEVLIVRK